MFEFVPPVTQFWVSAFSMIVFLVLAIAIFILGKDNRMNTALTILAAYMAFNSLINSLISAKKAWPKGTEITVIVVSALLVALMFISAFRPKRPASPDETH